MKMKYLFNSLWFLIIGILIVKIEGKKIVKRSDSGSFTILSYNIASCTASNARIIGEKLNNYDAVHIQEDFLHNKELTANLKLLHRTDFTGSTGNGMMTFTKFPLYTATNVSWGGSYGFCYSGIEVSAGFVIDIYNVFAPPNNNHWAELANYINTRSAGKSVIVFGYTNASYTYNNSFEELLLKPCGLKDAWVQNVMGGVAPAMGSSPLYTNQYGQKGEVLEKVWFRSGKDLEINAVNFEVLFNEFTDGNGRQLSAHYPITARIDYEHKDTYLTTNTFGGAGGQGFSFLDHMDGKLPKNIIIAAGDRIDRVGFTYESSGPVIVGGNGGSVNVYEFSAGEYITSMRVCKGQKNSFSTKRITFITFTTNFGGRLSAGKSTKDVKDFIAPQGYAIAGFIGSAKTEIDRLGVIYQRVY